MDFAFKEATKEQLKARVAIYGLSGSGKTIAALRIARYMADLECKNVAVIETEGRATNKYLGQQFDGESPLKFACLNMNGSFSPRDFIKAIDIAEKAGTFSTIVIDSLTHAWDGTLELADKQTWKAASPAHTALMSKIMNSSCHIIVTIRAEEELATEKDKNGKWKKIAIGMKPKSKRDIVYEFDMAGEIERGTNVLTLEKSRSFTMPVGSEYDKPGRNFAEPLYTWLQDGEAPAKVAAPVPEFPPPQDTLPDAHAAFVVSCELAETFEQVDQCKKDYYAKKSGLSKEFQDRYVAAIKAALMRVQTHAA